MSPVTTFDALAMRVPSATIMAETDAQRNADGELLAIRPAGCKESQVEAGLTRHHKFSQHLPNDAGELEAMPGAGAGDEDL